ncbi:40S ribosomal protein S5-1 [Hordeum vulgare]|nr:40S ribosomal protein S5-1 [Hordeum vulgare]
MLHMHDVEGPKKTGSMEARLEAMEQQVFKCQGMVERGLNANHMMNTEFINKHKIDANNIGKHLSRLYDRIDHLQAQIYDMQNQNWCSATDHTIERWCIRREDVRSVSAGRLSKSVVVLQSQPGSPTERTRDSPRKSHASTRHA